MARIIKICLPMMALLTLCSCQAENEALALNESTACDHTVTPKGTRVLGYDILNLTETGSFDDGVDQTLAMGLGFIQIHLYWNAIEIDTDGTAGAPYTMNFVDPGDTLAALNAVALAYNIKYSIIISPIDIPSRNVPEDLAASKIKFNDVIMSNRFNAFVDFLFDGTTGVVDPSIVTSLSVGNEIDSYDWAGNGDTESEYQTFLTNIKAQVNLYGVKLHFTGTHEGLLASGTTFTDMATVVDGVSVTYYPQVSGFQVKDPSVPAGDLANLVTKFSGKPIFLQEVGYQSSASAGSSEDKQAEFFCNFFMAWDSYVTEIPSAAIIRLNDVPLSEAEGTAVTYGLPGNTNFIEYIRTLGLRSYDGTGTDKKAISVITSEVTKRGW